MPETRETTDPMSGEKVTIRNDLSMRLRGKYAVGPMLANGEPEFGWRQMGEPSLIQLEAADEIERLRAALEELTNACEVEFESDQTDDEPDDEPVRSGQKPDGSPDYMGITFGMLRRARAALSPKQQ